MIRGYASLENDDNAKRELSTNITKFYWFNISMHDTSDSIGIGRVGILEHNSKLQLDRGNNGTANALYFGIYFVLDCRM